MPRPTFHNLSVDKQRRIIDAAIDEFALVPFESASVNRIVRAARIAKGSFYQYFDDMIDLYRYVVLVVGAQRKTAWLRAHPPSSARGLFGQLAEASVTGLRWGMTEPKLSAAASHVWRPVSPASALKPFQDELRVLRLRGMTVMLLAGQASGAVRADVDVDAMAPLITVLLTQGLDAMMIQRFGFDVLTLCAEPERAVGISDRDLLDIIEALIRFVRLGIGGLDDVGTLDMDAMAASMNVQREA